MSEQPKLRPCPACGGEDVSFPVAFRTGCACDNRNCVMIGPQYDPDGSKWNALPRRDDVNPNSDEDLLVDYSIEAFRVYWNDNKTEEAIAALCFNVAAAMLAELKRRRGVKP